MSPNVIPLVPPMGYWVAVETWYWVAVETGYWVAVESGYWVAVETGVGWWFSKNPDFWHFTL